MFYFVGCYVSFCSKIGIGLLHNGFSWLKISVFMLWNGLNLGYSDILFYRLGVVSAKCYVYTVGKYHFKYKILTK